MNAPDTNDYTIPLPVRIGKRLRQERHRLQLTQEGVAASCGMCKVAISNYERGVRSPDANLLAKLAEMGFAVDYVVTGTGQPAPDDAAPSETPTPLTPRMVHHLRLSMVQTIGTKNKATAQADRDALTRVIAAIAAELSIPYQP